MSASGILFLREAELRAAAENYAAWVKANNSTPKILNEAREELRAAAMRYANVVNTVNRKARKEFP